jgi:hypothetical protein
MAVCFKQISLTETFLQAAGLKPKLLAKHFVKRLLFP